MYILEYMDIFVYSVLWTYNNSNFPGGVQMSI